MNTAAVSSILIRLESSGTINANSHFALYGIKSA